MRASVLVLDSDGSAGAALAGRLSLEGYAAALGRSTEHADVLARRGEVDVLVLFAADAASLAQVGRVRAGGGALERGVGIIVIVPAALVVGALESGADDAVAQEAPYEEVRARLDALVRRSSRSSGPMLRAGAVSLERDSRRVSVGGDAVALRRLEFELLSLLIAEPDRVVPRAELMRSLWGGLVHSRTLDAHASRLRMRLARAGAPGLIVAVRGVGYRLR